MRHIMDMESSGCFVKILRNRHDRFFEIIMETVALEARRTWNMN